MLLFAYLKFTYFVNCCLSVLCTQSTWNMQLLEFNLYLFWVRELLWNSWWTWINLTIWLVFLSNNSNTQISCLSLTSTINYRNPAHLLKKRWEDDFGPPTEESDTYHLFYENRIDARRAIKRSTKIFFFFYISSPFSIFFIFFFTCHQLLMYDYDRTRLAEEVSLINGSLFEDVHDEKIAESLSLSLLLLRLLCRLEHVPRVCQHVLPMQTTICRERCGV